LAQSRGPAVNRTHQIRNCPPSQQSRSGFVAGGSKVLNLKSKYCMVCRQLTTTHQARFDCGKRGSGVSPKIVRSSEPNASAAPPSAHLVARMCYKSRLCSLLSFFSAYASAYCCITYSHRCLIRIAIGSKSVLRRGIRSFSQKPKRPILSNSYS